MKIKENKAINQCILKQSVTYIKETNYFVFFFCLGTVWGQEIVPLIMSGGDPASVDSLPNWERVPWLEAIKTKTLNLEQRPSPRIFASHFHYNMMPPSFFKIKPKVSLPQTPECAFVPTDSESYMYGQR